MNHSVSQFSDPAFDAYMRASREQPVLSHEEERDCAERWLAHADPLAMEKLVKAHMRLVVAIARKFSNYGFPLMDLVSAGNEGLTKSIHSFKPELGNRLSTFAMWHIRAAITEHVLKFRDIIKIGTTADQKKTFFNLAKTRAKFRDTDALMSEDTATLVSGYLGVSIKTVREVETRMSTALSLDAPLPDGERTFSDLIPSMSPDIEEELGLREEKERRQRMLMKAMEKLTQRERSLFERIHLCDIPPVMAEIAAQQGVSHQRIHQIVTRAFHKVTAEIASMSEAGTVLRHAHN